MRDRSKSRWYHKKEINKEVTTDYRFLPQDQFQQGKEILIKNSASLRELKNILINSLRFIKVLELRLNDEVANTGI